ncbi:class I SAM-dependent methyltransferase [Thermomonas fusca]|uniref:Class I SAM-dependent methyltransferase n=1 Tax=Thermomonas fusca TaxID=215690 RepID=A0A5R9PBP7_9GAMM|nr:class I SAM-dependent methyltransferase [Thermomonas fusca]
MSFRRRVIDVLYSSKLLKSVLFNPLAEFHQWRLLRFVRGAASSTAAGQRVIDVGAGELKYKPHFAHCQYVSSDLCIGDGDWSYAGIDIVSSAYDIPVESGSFDAVLCIQVLEHLDAPDRAFEEFHRVLKPGGYAYLSAPLLFGEHQQPHDFFRFTRYGLVSLGKRHGLKVLSIEPHGGCFIAIETTFWAAFWEIMPFRRQTLGRYLIYALLYPIKITTGLMALTLDMLDRKKSMTINYDVIYQKAA